MRILYDEGVEKWASFLYNHPKASVFQSLNIYKVYQTSSNFEPIAVTVVDESENILGTLLAVILKENKGFIGNLTARSIIWGAPLVKGNNIQVLDFILKEYNKIIKSKAIYTQFRNLWEWNEDEKSVLYNNGFSFDDHLDIIIDLKCTPDELFKSMHQGRRKNIRRAERIPLQFEEIGNKEDFTKSILLVQQTYKKVGLPCPDLSFFINANEILSEANNLKVFVAKYNDEIVASRFVLCFNKLIYDWYAGADENHLDKYPNDFLPFKIMEWGIKHDFELFDFGGAGKPDKPYGVRDFKLKFGGELVNMGRFEKVHKPILMGLGKIGFLFYKKLKNVRTKR